MSKTSMTAMALGAFGAALLASAASAAPLNATTIGSAEVSNVDQIGLVCNKYYGRCWRTRGPRYILRYYYDPSYFPGRGYNYYAGPGYYDRGYGYGGPRFTSGVRKSFKCRPSLARSIATTMPSIRAGICSLSPAGRGNFYPQLSYA